MTLDQWMTDQKWSDARLAAKVGVSRPFITRIRRGHRQPSLPVAVKLAAATELPIATFIKEVGA